MGKKGHLVDFVLLSHSYIQQKSEVSFLNRVFVSAVYLQVVRPLKR